MMVLCQFVLTEAVVIKSIWPFVSSSFSNDKGFMSTKATNDDKQDYKFYLKIPNYVWKGP